MGCRRWGGGEEQGDGGEEEHGVTAGKRRQRL